jgi:hypothetical protein
MQKAPRNSRIENQGNFVSEWFGYRTYPSVADDSRSIEIQQTGCCPFLSQATGQERACTKPESSSGICTIGSCSNGSRQDWLVCPYRALDTDLFTDVARRLFKPRKDAEITLLPAPTLSIAENRKRVEDAVTANNLAIVYFQGKLGGEISISPTQRSPELSFDTTMVEVIRSADGMLSLGRYGIFEVQTMDFHGSYRHAVKNLKDALRLHQSTFSSELRKNPSWLSDHIEGPNIANVFKRTFYQMMLKFKIGEHRLCAGCAIAIPASVWDSWQRHLGRPELTPQTDGTTTLSHAKRTGESAPAWIYVFDVDSSSPDHPNPIVLKLVIATDAESLAHYALRVVPDAALAEGGSADRILLTVEHRIAIWWPELVGKSARQ